MDKTCLSFFQQAIPDPFKADTNADIGEVFIALVYPHIEIIDYPEFVWIDCRQPGFNIEPDMYPLLTFLQEFPHVCADIINASEKLKAQYVRYLKEEEE